MKEMRLLALFFAAALFVTGLDPHGEKAPPFRGKTLDGKPFSNESLKGKVTLIQFWATWCGMCRRDEPEVEKLAKQYAGRDLVILAVSVGESRETVKKYLAQRPRSVQIAVNDDTNLPAIFGPRGFPTYVFLNRDGLITGVQPGAGGIEPLREQLRKAGL